MDTLNAARDALTGLPANHAAARFDAFVANAGLEAERHALWARVMLASDCCQKSIAYKKYLEDMPFEPFDADVPCYCSGCVYEDSSDDDCPRLRPLQFLHVYPKYACEDPADEAVHGYLVKIGLVPKPLPDMRDSHCRMIHVAGPHEIAIQNGFLTPDGIRDAVVDACGAEVLVIVFCGHGTGNGAFVASNGKHVRQRDVAAWLTEAGFVGTLVCVFNCCHAEPALADEASGWHAGLPFKWTVLYTCGPQEKQKPSHADHCARLVALLASERPAYRDLQAAVDRLWVETRDPKQKPRRWRGPPTVSMGVTYRGRFLGPAT
jgi:hypothetical protein